MPEINIADVVKDLVEKSKNELLLIITDDVPAALDAVNTYVGNLEGRASALLTNLAETNDASFLVSRLKEEPAILESEVFSFIIIGKGIAQNIVNSIQNILLSAIKQVLPVGNI